MFTAGLLRCTELMGLGFFFSPQALSCGIMELASKVEQRRVVLSCAQDYFKTEMRLF